MKMKQYLIIFLCAGLCSVQPMHAQQEQTVKQSRFQKDLTKVIDALNNTPVLGLSIGLGFGISTMGLLYLNQKSVEAWLTKIATQAIQNNAHNFPIYINNLGGLILTPELIAHIKNWATSQFDLNYVDYIPHLLATSL